MMTDKAKNPQQKKQPLLFVLVGPIGGLARRVEFQSYPVLIGRQPAADLRLSDPFASHVHCLVHYVNGVIMVQDLESRNGTVLNGESIRIADLREGDVIRIGITEISIQSIRVQ
jgi:pSer/pThr/pTyr-binding forkhead associated (FHA) protein